MLNGNLQKSPSTHKQCGLSLLFSKHTKNAIVSKVSNHHATRSQPSNKKVQFLNYLCCYVFASVLVVAVCGSSGRGLTINQPTTTTGTQLSCRLSPVFCLFLFFSLFSLSSFCLCFLIFINITPLLFNFCKLTIRRNHF